MTTESKLEKTKNESAINVILNFINEQIAIDFEDSSNARDMWLALLNRYEEQDHFAFMAFGDKSSPQIDIESIIASKNITDEITLEVLRDIAISKGLNAKEEKTEEEASTSTKTEKEVYLNSRLSFHGISDSDSESENEYNELSQLESLENEIARLNLLLSDSKRELSEKDVTIGNMKIEISNLQEKLKSKTNDFEISRDKVQNLETEVKALKSMCACSSNNEIGMDKMHRGQKPHDKSGLGYKKNQSSLASKNPKGQHDKGKQVLKVQNRNVIKQNKVNHAYRYGYNYRNQSKPKPNFGNNLEKVYYRGPNGWYYELVHRNMQGGAQFNVHTPKLASQQKQKWISKQLGHTSQIQKSKGDFKTHFIKGNINPPTQAFCNHCCHFGHISLECKFRKISNMSNVIWVPKKNT